MTFVFEQTDLVAFIDETGHHTMSDPTYPVFGLGGCAVPLRAYANTLGDPWAELRQTYFSTVIGALHAAELSPTDKSIDGLAEFFRTQSFYRVAALLTPSSLAGGSEEPFDLCATTLMSFLHQIGAATACRRIVLTFESAGSTDRIASRYFNQQARFSDSAFDFLPVTVFRAQKQDCLAGLEIADFIMHAAGTQVRRGLSQQPQRRDFQAVFAGVPDEWVRFGLLGQESDEPTNRLPVI